MNRVAVTGIGLVTPAGTKLGEFWDAVVSGRSGIGPITNISTELLKLKIAAEVKNFDPALHFESKQLSMLDRIAQFAVVAARSAVSDSGIDLKDEDRAAIAAVIGVGAGGQETVDSGYKKFYGEGSLKVHPLTVPRMMTSAAVSQVCIDLGLRGPAFSVTSACASSTHAVGQAFHLVRSGMSPLALAGGAESPLTPGSLKAWEALRILSPDTCRPFSKNRSGLVLGEGAAVLVLEELTRAQRRGARIYAEVCGLGMSSDALDLLAPDMDGAVRAMRAACADAKLDPGEIGYINAHGTGTRVNDRVETQAIKTFFGGNAANIPISSIKAVTGHGLGCAGAMEAAATALSLHHGIIPPTANYQEPDPECDLDYVPNAAREKRVDAALSNSFAFGGLNAALAMRRFS